MNLRQFAEKADEKNLKENLLNIDFGKSARIQRGFPFIGFRQRDIVKPLSGKWEIRDRQLRTYYKDDMPAGTESIALLGSRKWSNYSFSGLFSFLGPGMHPDEGGIILYFRYKNKRNHYSFHFCVSKQRIELWKRFQSRWSMVGEGVQYSFRINQPYSFTISSEDNVHTCYMDKEPVLQCTDSDIHTGCVGLAAKYCSAGFQHVSVSRRLS